METDGLPTPDNAIFGEIQVLMKSKTTKCRRLPMHHKRLMID
jgi:hypothetical protein